MKNEKKSDIKLNQAIFISVALHIFLVVFLAWSSAESLFNKHSNGEAIGAFMVDPAEVKQQYQRIAQQTAQIKQAEKNNKILAARQQKELNERQAENQRRMLDLQRQKLKAQQEEQIRKETEKRAQALAAQLAKAENEKQAQVLAAQKAQAEAEKQAQALAAQLAKEEAEKKARLLAEQRAKQEAEQKAKTEAEQRAKAKQEADAINLKANNALDDILSSKPTVTKSTTDNHTMNASQKAVSSDLERDKYIAQIANAIQNNFRDPALYKNKTCKFNLKLMPDGKLAQIIALQGDPALCRVATMAANGANIPRPPSDEIYQRTKDIELIFKPE